VSTRNLPYPREMEIWLADKLPAARGSYNHVGVYPKGKDGRRCAAWAADYYEVHVCPAASSDPLEPIVEALKSWPGCFRTTRVGWEEKPAADWWKEPTRVYKIADPDWPTKSKADDVYTRPMVWALISDPEKEM
jgi:hypothetical protein